MINKIAAVNIKEYFFGSSIYGTTTAYTDVSAIPKIVQIIIRFSFVLAGLILLFYFILGGIGLMSSAGKNDPKAVEEAKQTITSAVIGFVVVFMAYWIVKLLAGILKIPNLI